MTTDQPTEQSLEAAKQLKKQMRVRNVLRFIGRWFARIFTRIEVTGLENIPTEGPVIFGGNHSSTFDPILLLTYLPKQTQLVGPGDFKLLWPANLVVENIGLILTKRGKMDRQSIKQMLDVLKNNGLLALFPEGGTWEKGIEDVKSGAAYLSMMTDAPIVPMALGGTYQVWSKIFRLKRPKVSVHFCQPMPAVKVSDNRQTRQQELQDASVELMKVIYEKLPPEDQQMYDLIPKQEFLATLDFMPTTFAVEETPKLSGLAELVSKPNLFSPLHKNAKLPLTPFTKRLGQYTPAIEFVDAAHALKVAFEDEFQGYLEYRLGDEKAKRVYADLEELLPLAQEATKSNVNIRFTPHVEVKDE